MKKFIINTDGGSRANPGQAAAAFVIKDIDGVIMAEEGAYLGIATNNEAEYMAVKMALEKLLKEVKTELPVEVEVRTDSLLVASQLSGKYKIKNERLRVFITDIKLLEPEVGKVCYTYISRTQNCQADALVNSILDGQLLENS